MGLLLFIDILIIALFIIFQQRYIQKNAVVRGKDWEVIKVRCCGVRARIEDSGEYKYIPTYETVFNGKRIERESDKEMEHQPEIGEIRDVSIHVDNKRTVIEFMSNSISEFDTHQKYRKWLKSKVKILIIALIVVTFLPFIPEIISEILWLL